MSFFRRNKDKPVNLQVWAVNDPEKDVFPEQANGLVQVDANSVGIAFSGGGSRSHTLCSGYLRALHGLGHCHSSAYISAVSGGAWAASIYTFAQDDEKSLLGEDSPPSMCTVDYLKHGNPGKLAKAVSKDFEIMSNIAKFITLKVRAGDVWQQIIGKSILEDFNLDEKIMAANESHKNELLERNEKNKSVTKRADDIVIPNENRPFLIMSATMGGPDGYSSGWGNSLQFTPLYSGVPFYRRNNKMPYKKWTASRRLSALKDILKGEDPKILNEEFERQMELGNVKETLELIIGGGFVESFAFGTKSLNSKEDYFGSENAKGKIKNGKLFQIEDAVGASSAGFAAVLESSGVGDSFIPDADYFPILTKSSSKFSHVQHSRNLRMSDGGFYENTGVLPLLQRGVRKVICFVNTFLRLDHEFVVGRFNNEDEILDGNDSEVKPYYCADTQLLSMFGAVNVIKSGENYNCNQVFEKDMLNEVMAGLIKSFNEGNGALSRHTLKLLRNDDWNILGGYDVEVLFVYNECSHKFMEKLPDETLELLAQPHSPFGEFPFYKTLFQNNRPFSLELNEVSLLAALAEFIVKENSQVFADFFSEN